MSFVVCVGQKFYDTCQPTHQKDIFRYCLQQVDIASETVSDGCLQCQRYMSSRPTITALPIFLILQKKMVTTQKLRLLPTLVYQTMIGKEYWNAKSIDGNLEPGESIEVVGFEGLLLIVKRKSSQFNNISKKQRSYIHYLFVLCQPV